VPEPSDTDWAYAAGFVDGEGCIAITRSFVPARGLFNYSVQVVVSNRDKAVLEWLRENWGGWIVRTSAQGGHARPSWNWRAPTGKSALPFLTGLRPWLRIKTVQCDNALEMIELLRPGQRLGRGKSLPTGIREQQESRYWVQRELNHRGTTEFERKAMHSSRKIRRERLRGQPSAEFKLRERCIISTIIWREAAR